MENLFKKRKTNEKEEKIPSSGFSLELYNQNFGLDPRQLNDKDVLINGAGRSKILPSLEKANIHPKSLINLDLAYAKTKSWKRKLFKKSKPPFNGMWREEVPEDSIAGDMTDLPFTDNHFDYILAHRSVFWIPKEMRLKSVEESYRVCKEGGEIKIYPISFTKKTEKIIKQYPFLDIFIPEYDNLALLKADLNIKNSLSNKIRQIGKNIDSTRGEKRYKKKQEKLGNKVGTLTITKTAEIDQEKFKEIIEELVENDLIF